MAIINKVEQLSDKSFRSQLRKNPNKGMLELFSDYDAQGIEAVVKTNTKNTIYFVIPNIDDDTSLSSQLDTISVAGASTASSLGTVGTLISSVSCAGSWGTASSH